MADEAAVKQRTAAAADKFMESVTSGLDSMAKSTAEEAQMGFKQIVTQIESTNSERDAKRKLSMARIAQADLQGLIDKAKQEDQDLAKAMWGLDGVLASLGKEFTDLDKPAPEETAVIDAAKRKISEAEEELVVAQGRWFFRESAIRTAQENIAAAKTGLENAEVQVQQMSRQRLMNANLETSLQRFMQLVQRSQQILKKRVTIVSGQLQSVKTFRGQLTKDGEEAQRAFNGLTEKMSEAETQLKDQQAILDGLPAESEEHIEQETKVAQLRELFEKITMARNIAAADSETKKQQLVSLETHQTAHTRLLGNLQIWLKKLEADTNARVLLFRSRLEAKKANADQLAAQQLDKMGARLDISTDEDVAKISVASSKAILDLMNDMPRRFRDIDAIRAQQNEEIRKNCVGMEEALAQFKRQFSRELADLPSGDPLSNEFLTHLAPLEETREAA